MRELVGPGLEDQAQDGFKAAQRPFLAQGRGDGLVETLAMVRDPAHDVGEQRLVGFAVGLAVDLAAEAVVQEFTDDDLGTEPGVQRVLVERLDGAQPGHAAPAAAGRRARSVPLGGARRAHPLLPTPAAAKRRFAATIARQARTASPPLSRPLPPGVARTSACASLSQVRMP